LLCAVLGTVTPGARASDVPAGLAVEHFDTFGPDSTASVTGRTCDRNGQSTLTFVAEGPASGPYTGRFHEEGTVTLGPHVLVLAVYLLLAWQERGAWRALFSAEHDTPASGESSPLSPAF